MNLLKADRQFQRRTRAGLSALLAGVLLLLPLSPAGAAPAPAVNSASLAAPVTYVQAKTFDAQLIALINTARTAAKVPKLVEASGLTRLSVWWSTKLQSGTTGYQLQHNPNAWTMVTTYGASNRRSWGENVAWSSSTATSAQQIFTAYMNSPGHRANILAANYRFIGMGSVAGAHGLFNTTEFADAVQPGQAVVPVPADGKFVVDRTTKAVYVIAGGAPVYVSSWAPFGGPKPTIAVDRAQLVTWPAYPREGTFIRTANSKVVYRIAGGAPVYVSSWALFGGPKPTVDIDPAAVAKAGTNAQYSHLRVLPKDGTFIRTLANGAVYRIAGGAPLYVASWGPVGGPQSAVEVDAQAVAHSGQGGAWAHLLQYPMNSTYLKAGGTSTVYRVFNGKATHVLSWASVGGLKPFTVVHPLAISNAGTGGVYNHLKK
jgi:uncharacterized protein YkwD